ncbi:hypothetical protein GALL_430600 [mine drainage metagenome]|uniref:Uncharacterized protein n=1 Tax=mine drainage metagenome TaxID=410659 RepID=A0A1J5Q5V7_9ZZZZ
MDKPEWFQEVDAADSAPELVTDPPRAARFAKRFALIGAAALIAGVGVAMAQSNSPSPAEAAPTATATTPSTPATTAPATTTSPVATPVTTPTPETPATGVTTESAVTVGPAHSGSIVGQPVAGTNGKPSITGAAASGGDDGVENEGSDD